MLKKNSTEQTGDRETNSTFHLICTTLCTFTPSLPFIQRNVKVGKIMEIQDVLYSLICVPLTSLFLVGHGLTSVTLAGCQS